MSNDVYVCDPQFQVERIIVKKLPDRCHPEKCYFAWISKTGYLYCHALNNEFVREVKKSKNFAVPYFCPLGEE